MKTRTKTHRSVLLSVVGLFLAGSLLAAEPPPPPAVGETWACNYRDGKDFDDKMKARDYMVDQTEKAGLQAVPAWHMTQIKGMAPVQTLWMDVHPNLEAFGTSSAAWEASGIGPAVQARFDAVEECTSGLSTLRAIHEQENDEEDGNETSLVVTLACNYLHGRGSQNMPDLTNHMGMTMASMGADAPGFSYLRTPITGGPNFPDVFISSVFDDMAHWTRWVGLLYSTDAGESMLNHMDMIVDCNISMWSSQQVVMPAEE